MNVEYIKNLGNSDMRLLLAGFNNYPKEIQQYVIDHYTELCSRDKQYVFAGIPEKPEGEGITIWPCLYTLYAKMKASGYECIIGDENSFDMGGSVMTPFAVYVGAPILTNQEVPLLFRKAFAEVNMMDRQAVTKLIHSLQQIILTQQVPNPLTVYLECLHAIAIQHENAIYIRNAILQLWIPMQSLLRMLSELMAFFAKSVDDVEHLKLLVLYEAIYLQSLYSGAVPATIVKLVASPRFAQLTYPDLTIDIDVADTVSSVLGSDEVDPFHVGANTNYRSGEDESDLFEHIVAHYSTSHPADTTPDHTFDQFRYTKPRVIAEIVSNCIKQPICPEDITFQVDEQLRCMLMKDARDLQLQFHQHPAFKTQVYFVNYKEEPYLLFKYNGDDATKTLYGISAYQKGNHTRLIQIAHVDDGCEYQYLLNY